MATMEKLMKAFESLRSFQQQQTPAASASASAATPEEPPQRPRKDLSTSKKDRVNHCLTICENIVAQRNSPEFQKLLGIAMELFLLCSDDSESDVRMVADECLNKVIKALMDSNLPRLQLELYKEIKKNGASRSLRAALWRFAELAHLVRPLKCRPYLENLLPCLTRVCKRSEESVQETLAAAIPKIMSAFGNFANDNEIKALLKTFVANLKSSSPTIRRTAAASAVSICQHSRRTQYFYTWLLNVLLGLLFPIEEEYPTVLILGVLLTLRYLIPLLQQQVKDTSLKGSFGMIRKETEISPSLNQLIQVYELTLHYTQHQDHNVVTGALELLQQLLRTTPPDLLRALTTAGGIAQGSVSKDEATSRNRSDSIVELIAIVVLGEEEGLEDETDGRSEVSNTDFAASMKTELAGELTSSSGVPTAGSVASSVANSSGRDIITEQPRSQHTLQPESDLTSCDLTSAAIKGDSENDLLSGSSSQVSTVLSDPAVDMDGSTQASSPISDSSQTTTEGPDSAVTPSDSSEMILESAENQYSGMQIGQLQDEEDEASNVLQEETIDPFRNPYLALQQSHLLKSMGHSRQPSDSSVDRFLPKEEMEPGDHENKPSRIKGDIGHYTDGDAAPLVHCVRLLSASFLLMGEKGVRVPDKDVRVSVKALAVSCVGAAVALHPEAFFSKLYKMPLEASEEECEEQYVSDIVNYIDHGDPQIRGATAILCGTVVCSILTKSRFNVENWLASIRASTGNSFSLVDCIPLLQRTLKDASSVTCKLACTAVRHCIMSLCSSSYSTLGLQLIVELLTLRNSSYWLVRTELLETLAEIDFRLVSFLEGRANNLHRGAHHYTGLLNLQERMLNNVVISLLGDEDPRVRHVAAASLIRLVPKLFFRCDQGQADPMVAVARDQSSVYLKLLMHETQPASHFAVSTITRTYRGYNMLQSPTDVTMENNLSRVISAISHALTTSSTRSLTFGCCEALCLLSTSFPVCTWNVGWHCGFSVMGSTEEYQKSCTIGMAGLVLSLLSSAWFPLDLSAHQDALILAGNLLAASSLKSLKNPWTTEEDSNAGAAKQEEPWPAVANRTLVALVEQIFSHLLKVINICAHVMDDVAPGPAIKATLPSLTNPPSLSPIRRKGKEKEVVEQASVAIMSPKKSGENSSAPRQMDASGPAPTSKSSLLGNFYHLPSYLKLYDVLKATHANYKVTLDLQNSTEKFGGFLRSALDVLSQILELATLQDIGKYVEEILGYLKSCFNREPMMATVCVQQLLKTLFGTNLASQYDCLSSNPSRSQGKAQRLGSSNLRPGLYHYCFMAPYTHFTQALADASLRNMVQAEQEHDTSGWFDVLQKVSAQLKTGLSTVAKHRADKNIIHNHIRLFEPLVIKALKQYTTTTSVQLQRQVLDLLAQLVQLRVNYCLLDSDQVFIGFVLKQFEYIEVGLFRGSEAIIPSIFFFLVLLSYERYHSKQIIGIPKIIQLCDGIMASGRKAVTHAIPALQPIVHDLFILRGANKADAGKELETQKEVVVSMLLRLIQYHQVLEMFILVLQQCHKENEDKWKRLSRQIADIILPKLAKQQMHIDSHESLGVLNTLFEILAPSALRPVDMLLRSMFVTPSTMGSVSTVQLWISGILAILRVLISQSTEDIVLSRIQELSFSPYLISCVTINRLRKRENITSAEEQVVEEQGKHLPEETFSRFLLQLVGILLEDITTKHLNVDMNEQQHTFYCQELGTLLMCLIHTFKSGMFRRITAAAAKLFTGDGSSDVFYTLESLNGLVQSMIPTHPSLVLLWCQILLLVNYTDCSWWSEVHQTPKRYSLSSTKLLSPQISEGKDEPDSESKLGMCNREIVRRGALILFCDYVCQNLHDSEHLTWLIVNHVQDLIDLSHEPPVQDFISAIHRNSAASGLFIQAIQSRCENFTAPTTVKKTLQCLEGIHLSQSGAVLMFYVDRLLCTPFRVLARVVDTLACRRVEMLLAPTLQNSIAQLPVEELDRIQEYLQNSGLAQRHQRLYSLLDRFRLTVASETSSPPPCVTSHPLDGENQPALETITPDKDWYVSLVSSQCCTKSDSCLLEGAELVNRLPEPDLSSFMTHKDFNISLLASCLSLGMRELSRDQKNLFETTRRVTLDHVTATVQKLPISHQVFQPLQPIETSVYWNKLSDIFGDTVLYQSTMVLSRALSQYLVLLCKLPTSLRIPHDKESDILKFVVMSVEILSWHLIHEHIPLSVDLQAVLDCCCLMLQQSSLWNLLASALYMTHACSLINCVRFIIEAVAVEPGNQLLGSERKSPMRAASEDEVDSQAPKFEYITATCETVAELVECLQSVLALGHKRNSQIPAFLTPVLKNIIISLSRLPLVNSYARIPPLVWKLGWSPKPIGDFGTTFPEIPVEFLQEREIFKEFIYRINTLGWTNRMQFEETWATLLGVLVTQPIVMDQEENQQEEDTERTQINVLAVQAITSLVLSALTIPVTGNPAVSSLEQQPRNKALKALDTRFGRKLNVIRGIVEQEIQEMASKRDNIVTHHLYQAWDPVPSLSPSSSGAVISHENLLLQINTEREIGNMGYKLGQVSIHSVWLGNNITPLREEEWDEDEDDESEMPAPSSPLSSPINSRKHRAGVDIHSCSQFLLELYTQWILPSSPSKRTPVILISEVVRSLLAVSDLFTERNQFEMMYTTLTELRKMHPAEDEILVQYLVPATCKAAAVLGMDKAVAEPVSRLLESTLRSTYMPSRIGALHGILYILECDLLDETAKQLIPVITEYLLSNLKGIAHCVNVHNQQHALVMCAVAFYLIENYPLDVGPEFSSGIIQMCGVMLSGSEESTPSIIYHCILRGLERLLLSEQLSRLDSESLVKLSVDRVNVQSPHRAMAALGLMLTCMYTGKEKISPGRVTDSNQAAPDSESVIVAMERVSVLFDRVRKGFPFEARVVARILPQFLDDFFPPQDVMNKVIGEFLSNQQPYPQFMATVVYKVFQTLHTTGQSSMVRDWVMLSLSNFTQRTPVAMAMWSLSCFFVSASTSQWISAILPHIISRMGKSEQVDVNLFCLVAIDFYRHQIDEELDRRAFQSVFEVVATPGNPYHRLLTCLQNVHKVTAC
ncbi:huntingtin isoform X2 [Eublepharis macularius]|uniref:Huntingtin n=1 Tax=Eublepharis macularius TaxID=481883 RepID=A0AA97KDQ3_EUBMA|nr:huntingtin isoform X2 [Eublepharis macularius]